MRWYVALRTRSEISHVRRRGRAWTSTALAVYGAPAAQGSRAVVTVGKAVGGAVVRNRVRRRIKGALDALGAPSRGVRLVLIARPEAAGWPYARLERAVAEALARVTESSPSLRARPPHRGPAQPEAASSGGASREAEQE